MHRLLERLDALGGTLVPLAYLAGLLLGTMTYFVGSLSGIASLTGWGATLAVAVGFAVGSELHAFLQQRRARASWEEYERLTDADSGKAAARARFKTNAYILAALIVFQCFTGIGFAASNWRPSGPPLVVALQIVVRGCIIPVFFFLASFLRPLQETAGAVLAQASQDILHYAVRRNVKHWYKRIKRVHALGGDLSPLMVALLNEEGETVAARRTALIAANLQHAEGELGPRSSWMARLRGQSAPGGVVAALLPATEATENAHNVTELPPIRLNTQPASDVAAPVVVPGVHRGTPMRSITLVSDEKPPSSRKGGMTRHTGGPGKSGKQQRRDVGRQSAEVDRRTRRIVREMLSRLEDGEVLTIEDVADFTGMSRGTAVTDRSRAFDILRHEHPVEWEAIQQVMGEKKRLHDV